MQKKISVKDIAQELNISLSTVHKALTGKSGISETRRQEVLQAAQRMGYVVNSVAQSLARKTIHIGVAMPSKWQAYFADMKKGIEKEILTLQTYKVQGSFYLISSDDSADETKKFMVWLREQAIDALIYCPSIYSFGKGFFDGIRELGIPVFMAGDGYEEVDSVSVIVTDAARAAKQAADFLHCICSDTLRAAVLTGSLGVKPHRIKAEAFKQRIEAYGGVTVGIYETEEDEAKAYGYMDEICACGVNAIYVSTATSSAVCQYLDERNMADKIALVCTDIFDELYDYMQRNIVKATIYQHQETVGRRVVRAAYDYIVDKNSYGCENVESEPLISVSPSLCLLADIEP